MSRETKTKKMFEEMKKHHHKAVAGDRKAVKAALDLVQKLKELDPENALIEAYRGSVHALLARDAAKTLEKAELAEEGLDALNRAVALDPENKEIRLIRAHVCMRLPDSYFRCAAVALEDFRHLAARDEESPGFLTKKQKEEVMKCIRRLTKKEVPR